MAENDKKVNTGMITITLPDVSDEQALKIKQGVSALVDGIEEATVDLRLRNAKIHERPIPGSVLGGRTP